MDKHKKRLLLWLLFIPLALLATMVLVVALLLGTSSGRLWLVEQGINRLNQTELNVQLDGLVTDSLGHWRWHSLSVSSGGTRLLDVSELKLRFAPMALLSRQLRIISLTAEQLQWHKLPEPSEEQEPEADEPLQFALPQSPIRVTIEHLKVDLIQLPEGYAGTLELPTQWELQGNADLFADRGPPTIDLEIRSREGTDTSLTISSKLIEPVAVAISGHLIEQPGGALGAMVKQPDETLDLRFALQVEARKKSITVAIEKLTTSLSGHPLEVQGTVRASTSGNDLQIRELIIHTDQQKHKFKASITKDDAWLEFRLREFPLDLITPWVPAVTAGQISGSGHLSWLHAEPQAWPSGTAELSGTTTYQGAPLAADIEGTLKNKILTLQPSTLSSDETRIEVEGRFDWLGDTSQLDATVTQASTALLDTLKIERPEIIASLNATVPRARLQLSGNWRDPFVFAHTEVHGDYQEQPFFVEVEAKGNLRQADIAALTLETGGGRLNSSGTLDWTGEQTDLSLQVSNLNDALIKLIPPEYNEALQDLSFTLDGSAEIRGALLTPQVDSDLVMSREYTGLGDPLPYQLVSRGTVKIGPPSELRIGLERFTLALFDQPVISAQGTYRRETLDLTLDIASLPTRALALFGINKVTGEAEAHVELAGNFDNPIVKGHASYRDSVSTFGRKPRKIPAEFTVDLETVDGTLQVGSHYMLDSQQMGQLNIQLPLKRYLQPHDGAMPLDLAILGDMDLKVTQWLLDPGLHDLRGKISADMRVRGTVAEPEAEGTLKVTDGYYEHAVSRTQWENMQANIEAKGSVLNIQEIYAGSGNNGFVKMHGSINWGKQERLANNAIDLVLQANDAIVMRQRNLYAEVNGQLDIEGSFAEIWVTGDASVSPLDASIEAAMQSSIPSIEITEVKHGDESATPSIMPTINLELAITADQQAYIRGRGLEAELEGRFNIQGTAENPQYTGVLRTRRGRMDLFGKRFQLQTGEVRLSNGVVSLRIPTVYTSDDLEVNAEIYGTSDSPQVRLSSNPPLPEDEILSRLIFGKSVEQVTAFQAVRLAAAVNSLRSGGGFDPVDSARQMLGVDTLNIENESTENGSGVSVGVGKYISERVYLQLERTPNPVQPWQARVQIELTPKLRLESGTSENGGAGAELLWKRDY